MKKIWIFALAALLLLTACQPTPEAEIVVQKNTDQMIEAALATPEPGADAPENTPESPGRSALYDALGIPEQYQAERVSRSGKMTLNIDVEIDVPQADALPVARVVPANFSQAQITAMYDHLVGDTPMFERPEGRDKAQLEKEILSIKQRLADPDNKYREFDEKLLKEFEKQYATAPDRHVPVPGGPTLNQERVGYDETDVLNGIRTSLDLVSELYDGGMEFTVRNNTEYDDAGTYFYIDENGNTHVFVPESGAVFHYHRSTKADGWGLTRYIEGNIVTDVTAESLTGGVPAEATLINITPIEARETAQAFLDAIGAADMVIDRVSLMSSAPQDIPPWWWSGEFESEQEWMDAGSPDPFAAQRANERQGYEVLCLRSLNGVPVASDLDGTNEDGSLNSPGWQNEKLYIGVDDAGISTVIWLAPLAVTEVITENATVKPFAEISEIIEKMMFVVYEPYSKMHTITEVRLSLQRISEQDSFENGLLAPVWNVYGYETRYVSHDDGETFQWEDAPVSIWPLLTINAIDGSVIDLLRGY